MGRTNQYILDIVRLKYTIDYNLIKQQKSFNIMKFHALIKIFPLHGQSLKILLWMTLLIKIIHRRPCKHTLKQKLLEILKINSCAKLWAEPHKSKY